MALCESPELGWQGKGQQKVFDWHPLLKLTLQPLLTLMSLAVGAVVMPTGVREIDLVIAIITANQHFGAFLRVAASSNKPYDETTYLNALKKRGSPLLKQALNS